MERRRFLRNLALGIAATAIPTKVITDVLGSTKNTVIGFKGKEFIKPGYVYAPYIPAETWNIDYETKNIIYNGGWNENSIKIGDLYNFLKEEWDEEIAEFPMEKRGKYTYIINELTLQTT